MTCYLCKRKAVGSLSNDLDIVGLPFCEKHREKMFLAYLILINEGEKKFNKFIKKKRNDR